MLRFDLFSLTEAFIKKHELVEIKSSRIFERPGKPDPEGLASSEIFGEPGTNARKTTFAYIDLKDRFIHPHVLFELKSIKKIFIDCVFGVGEYYLSDDGLIAKYKDGVDTKGSPVGSGPDFLYKIWDKLDFQRDKELEVGTRFFRLRFLHNIKKSQVFISKYIVIPPFYRDVDNSGERNNEINTYYAKLINIVHSESITKDMLGNFNTVTDNRVKIQTLIYDFYSYMISVYAGRKGFFHKHVMGKRIDLSARLVISGTDVAGYDSPSDLDVDFERSNLPLFATVKCFAPFILNGIVELINNTMKGGEYIWVKQGKKYVREKVAENWEEILSSEYIYNLIELYAESQHHRLQPFTIPLENGEDGVFGFMSDDGEYIEDPNGVDPDTIQPLRLIHLFYMIAYEKVRDMKILITRYPIEDYNNTYPSKMTIIPYKRTTEITINGVTYPHFPVVHYEKDINIVSSLFVDSLNIFSGYLSAINGDFDGDMVSVIGVFNVTANRDLENYIKSAGNMIGMDCKTTRKVGVLATQTIFISTSPEEGK